VPSDEGEFVKRPLPYSFFLPLAAASAVIAIALGFGMFLFWLDTEYDPDYAIAGALAATILIMGVAIYLDWRSPKTE
jgi:prepilin signal peptidase PulO-like enzyme (type II secretory pathway)